MFANHDDDGLMQLAAEGEKRAFHALYDRHNGLVLGYCMRMLAGNRALAEDLSQDAWIRVAENLKRYQAQGQFRSWLMTITRNSVLSHFRRKKESGFDDPAVEANVAAAGDLEKDLIAKHDAAEVRKGIESLPDAQRVILVLWLTEDLSYDEMAAQLGVSEPSVRNHLSRAKKALRERLEKR